MKACGFKEVVPMKAGTIAFVLAGLQTIIGSELRAQAGRAAGERHVEIFKYEVNPAYGKDESVLARVDQAMLLEGHEVRAYVVVFHLAPGERLVSARGEVRDGFVCRRTPRRTGRAVGRALGSMGYRLLLKDVPSELREGLNLLGDLTLMHPAVSARPEFEVQRRLRFRARDLDQREGLAATIVVLAANSVTRVAFPRIVTRKADGARKPRRHRSSARPALVPGPADPELSREELVRILLGQEIPSGKVSEK
jgi:hypothetical protein